MNGSVQGQEVADAPGEHAEAYEFELKAAQNHLGAEASDLASLLAFILQQAVSREQIQRLLEQAYARLQSLREVADDLGSNVDDTDISAAIEIAVGALQTGESFSLADADQAFEQIYRQCIKDINLAELAARMRAVQALIAAVALNFRHAAALYAEAAATVGIEPDLQWQYLYRQASVLEDLGREFVDIEALQAAAELYENRILPLTPRDQCPAEWSRIQDCLGTTLGILGQRQRGTRMLERAIEAFDNSLTQRERERTPFDWASTQNNLGNALGILGQRHRDEELLEKSITAFDSALEVRTQSQSPEEWATTQNNLAAVLLSLGQRKKDAKMLKRAVDAYKALLTVWTRERLPFIWGTTMNNLGNALRLLGEHRKGPRTLEQSVAAYNAALSVTTRTRVPHDWAMTQNNLGAALQVLGERTDDPLVLGRAVAAYRETLKEWTREREPMSWAMTMANLGVARCKLAERNRDIEISRRASADLKMAVDVFRGASHAQLTELGEEQLAVSRKLTASLEAETKA
ncbi:MAG: tetratricopeptide repeat protein [Gammaproteobacteria bacterium]|nr:tetratricopeptide repeat protein [Gammaproteobacteria bacterium]MDH3447956.1 tetratricopeptide repeat protein [Gammaproteobacteria bacterium]